MARLASFLATMATLLFLGVHVAHASSKSWQSGMKPQDPVPVRRLVLNSRGYADIDVNRNETNAHARLQKRTGSVPYNRNGFRIWEDRMVRYCFETEAGRTALEDLLHQAVSAWQNVLDTPGVHWEWERAAPPGAACINHPDRASIVAIRLENSLASSVGIPAFDQANPANPGPWMRLTPAETTGALNRVANIAHEVGHVWGLFHEHQNPWYWATERTNWVPFDVSDPNSFKCENLDDHEEAMERARDAGIDPPELICQDLASAITAEFSAAMYLPYLHGEVHTEATDEDDIDWDSIMLYPSTAGGRGTAAPPTTHPDNPNPDYFENDHRAEVLLGRLHKGNNPENWVFERFGANLIPSESDAETLQFLYGEEWPDLEWTDTARQEVLQALIQANMC